ncbi:hypothetical protein CHL78_005560 [Romboutsia weinsteinii]|uniref:Alpha/beta hydrolase n=1 Tax=Romboutsia weinsteinii TaxID=2020949 RepID=A0A371J6R6_9FIRM|nr:hypothetical protein [Romboutsia weinsteinii]RDY28368.1 hypothetical protein CHL78_005560 [Romboutsia weinsteinii]
MIKKVQHMFICLFSIMLLIIFLPSDVYASLEIGGDSFETINGDMIKDDPDILDTPYFTLDEVMKKLDGIKSDVKNKNAFQYVVSSEEGKDIIVFDRNTFKISVNGKLLKDKYLEEDNKIYAPFGIFNEMKTSRVVDSGIMDTLIVTPPKHKYNDVSVYNLGEDKYVLPDNVYIDTKEDLRELTYDNTGSICVPDGKKLPLVIFLHASAAAENMSPYFSIGYSDNKKALANEGFASIGLNLTPVYYLDSNKNYQNIRDESQKALFTKILKKHVQSLLDNVNSNTDTNNIYGFDMKDKIDFNNVILVGHSRGGQNLFLAYDILKEMGINAKGAISMAPAKYWKDFDNYPDIPTGIIIPQLDGDVVTLDGRKIFDDIRLQKRKKDLQLLYLYSANHNNFNSTIFKIEDSFVYDKDNIPKEAMPGDEQRAFASKYIVNFAKSSIKKGNLSSILPSSDGNLYKQKVLMSFVKGDSQPLFDATSDSDLKMLSGSFKKIIASTEKQKNTTGNIRLPGVSEDYQLVSLEFKNRNDKVNLKLSKNNDFTNFNALCLEVMQDSTDSLNKGRNQMLDITITDKDGKSETVSTSKDSYALQYQPGKMTSISIGDEEAKTMYSNFTPLSTLMIPVEKFSGQLDISNISTIEISASNSTKKGSFILQSMYLSSTDVPNDEGVEVENSNSIAMYISIFCIVSFVLFVSYKKLTKK